MPLFELRPPIFAGADWATKRAFDLVVSVARSSSSACRSGSLIALAIKLDSRGPVFYRDRAHRRRRAASSRCSSSARWCRAPPSSRRRSRRTTRPAGALFKIRDDPRVTRVGRFLRRLSLDEMPNVLNVLRGEMCLVGPRPLPLRDYGQLEDWHRRRYHVLPGMTGLWQVAGRSNLTFDDLVRLDFYYLENWSIWLDISILAQDAARGRSPARRLLARVLTAP